MQFVGEPQAGKFFDFLTFTWETRNSSTSNASSWLRFWVRRKALHFNSPMVSEGEDYTVFPRQRDVAVEAVIVEEYRTTKTRTFMSCTSTPENKAPSFRPTLRRRLWSRSSL